MAGIPVLVVHGVANRDQNAFNQEVSDLQEKLGGGYRLIPAWWADLGGKTNFLDDTLPDMGQPVVRSELDDRDLLALGASISSTSPEYLVRAGEAREEIIVRSAQEQLGTTTVVRSDGELETAIHQAWNSSTYLPLIRDQRALQAIGRAVAVASGSADSSAPPSSPYVTRGSEEDESIETRGIKDAIGNAARAVMGEIDKVVGYAVGQVVGDLNQSLRGAWAAPIGLFLGDILAYQRKQPEIQDRLIATINEHAPGWGTKEKPITVAAHSLGGVIAFDAATRADSPLWISGLVTFGSQASFFEVLDPRPALATYAPGAPILLPPTIGRWTSLWEPLDVLAFATEKVFRLSSGQPPIDIRTVHDLKNGFATHGSYWHSDELVEAIRDIAPEN